MQTKAWYQSKTVWLNLITTAILILGIFTAALSSSPEPFSAWVPWLIGIVVAILNVVMRVWLTDTGIDSSAAKEVKAAQK